MSWRTQAGDEVAVLAVIPARGGSKGLPGKNLRRVGGISLVGRAARLASGLAWIDRTVVSTDDPAIAAEAVCHGAAAPFLRPAELASDTAASEDAWRHAWEAAEAHYGTRFEVSLLLEPTSPLRAPDDLAATMAALVDGGHASAATVSRTPGHYTPHKTLTVDGAGRIGFLLEGGARFARRQAVPALYHRNGLAYAVRRSALLGGGPIIGGDCAAVVVDRPVVNIDDAFELELAEWLIARREAVPELAESA